MAAEIKALGWSPRMVAKIGRYASLQRGEVISYRPNPMYLTLMVPFLVEVAQF
jgi:hypothetical protein